MTNSAKAIDNFKCKHITGNCFVGDTKVLVFEEVPTVVAESFVPIPIYERMASVGGSAVSAWFALSLGGVVVVLAKRKRKNTDQTSLLGFAIDPDAERGADRIPVLTDDQFETLKNHGVLDLLMPNATSMEPSRDCRLPFSMDSESPSNGSPISNIAFDQSATAHLNPRAEACLGPVPADMAGNRSGDPANETNSLAPQHRLFDSIEPSKSRGWQLPAVVAAMLLAILATVSSLWPWGSPAETRQRTANLAPAHLVSNASDDRMADLSLATSGSHRIAAIPIRDIRVGMRVPAHNPQHSDAERAAQDLQIDPSSWRRFALEVEKQDGSGTVQVELLRPSQWLVDEIDSSAASLVEWIEQQDPQAQDDSHERSDWLQALSTAAYLLSDDAWQDIAQETIAWADAVQPFLASGDPLNGLVSLLQRSIDRAVSDHQQLVDLEQSLVADVQAGGGVGTELWLDLPELGAVGWATVVANDAYTQKDVDALLEQLGHIENPTPETHRLIRLRAQRPDGSRTEIALLRSLRWIASELGPEASRWALTSSTGSGSVGSRDRHVFLDIPELRLNDVADVVGIYPCPDLATGPGELVTASYITDRANVIDLGFEDLGERIGTTAEHPFWSVTRQEFVDAGKLQIGEEVLALSGRTTRLTDITPRAGPETVYNFEVAGEHVYYVGSDGLLVHNAVYLGKIVSSKTGKGIQKATQPPKLKKSARRLKNGSTPSNIAGKRAHAKYNPGKNYNKKYQLPSGRRPDAIDLKKRIVRELKPYNQRNVARGTKQLEGYITELESTLGGKWTGILDFWK